MQKPPLFATIDIGTNSAQLLIGRINDQGLLESLIQEIRTPRLGLDLKKGQGSISPESLARLKLALDDFGQIIRNTRSQVAGVVLTEAVRRADNPLEILWCIEQSIPCKPEIISGQEEAKLSYLGVRSFYRDPKLCVMDIGAGSIELATDTVQLSLPIGALRMSQEFGIVPGPAMDKHVKELCKIHDLKPFTKCNLVVSGGTATALAMTILDVDHWQDPRIEGFIVDETSLEECFIRLSQISEEVRCRMPGLEEGRSQIILPGLKALLVLQKILKIQSIKLSNYGLKQGILLEFLQKTI